MKKEWKQPFWETAAKDRLTVRLNITHDDGSFSTSVAKVSKYDDDGNITSDYDEVMQSNTMKEIDAFTEERLTRHKQTREANVKKQKERNASKNSLTINFKRLKFQKLKILPIEKLNLKFVKHAILLK
jgi:hypothetical protein